MAQFYLHFSPFTTPYPGISPSMTNAAPPNPDWERLKAGLWCIGSTIAGLLIVHLGIGELLQFKIPAKRFLTIYIDLTAWAITRAVEVSIIAAVVWLAIWLAPMILHRIRHGGCRNPGAPPP